MVWYHIQICRWGRGGFFTQCNVIPEQLFSLLFFYCVVHTTIGPVLLAWPVTFSVFQEEVWYGMYSCDEKSLFLFKQVFLYRLKSRWLPTAAAIFTIKCACQHGYELLGVHETTRHNSPRTNFRDFSTTFCSLVFVLFL
jgi:hypothetical protein